MKSSVLHQARRLPYEVAAKLCDTQFDRHFFNVAELNSFKKSWVKNQRLRGPSPGKFQDMPADQLKDFGNNKWIHYLENAIITPTSMDTEKRTFTGCVYDRSRRLVTAAQRTSHHVAWKPADPLQLPEHIGTSKFIDGHCIYLGHYSGHYGHFLLETLSRFWILRDNAGYDKLIFQPFIHEIPSLTVFSPAKVAFDCFNIKRHQVVLVNRQIQCAHLAVPNSLVQINNRADAEQGLIYKQIAEYCEQEFNKHRNPFRNFFSPALHDSAKHRRLYLSRKKIKSSHYITNELETEKLFAEFGFTIIHPESLDFRDQVVLYKRAGIIAGFAGSALHNSVFMNNNSLTITLGDLRRPNENHPNQVLCDALSGTRSIFIKFQGTVSDPRLKIGRVDLSYLRSQLEQVLAESHTAY